MIKRSIIYILKRVFQNKNKNLITMEEINVLKDMHKKLGIKTKINIDNVIREEKNLVSSNNSNIWLESRTSDFFNKMYLGAKNQGIKLKIKSGYRGWKFQFNIIKRKLKQNRTIENILLYTKLPGYSEHHSGRAIDISGVNNQSITSDSQEYKWLKKNAGRYGFRLSYPENGNEMGFEPWHWYYLG
jgi:zinc D-Ala-D-Ala carboxypeptidase